MRCIKFFNWIAIGLFGLIMPLSSMASDEKKGDIKSQSVKTQEQKIAMPVYKPPLRGAPIGRVGGGTRGTGSEMPFLAALAPEHTGLTFKEQPSWYWYLSKTSKFRIEFTLIDEESIQPLFERNIEPPVKPGIHGISLGEYKIRLTKGKQYKWFVAMVPDPDHRSKDIIAGGAIEIVDFPLALKEKLANAEKAEKPNIFAESGIWYDALSAISDLIDASPNDPILREKRISLLEQVGLSQVADEI